MFKNLNNISFDKKTFLLKRFLANFNFVVLHFKNRSSCSFKYFKSSEVIVVKKKS